MIKIENRSKEEVAEIGRKIGEAFAKEPGIFPYMFSHERVIKALEIMTELYYVQGVLYTFSENEEGYVAYWQKTDKMKILPFLMMIKKLIGALSFRECIKFLQFADNQYEKVYKKASNYVVVSMVAVCKEYQGKGYLHQLLEKPFLMAEQKGIPCVLDTDSELKKAKYEHCGMKMIAEKQLNEQLTMYTMAYNDKS